MNPIQNPLSPPNPRPKAFKAGIQGTEGILAQSPWCPGTLSRSQTGDGKFDIKVHYDGVIVGDFVADLIVENQVIVVIKAARVLVDSHVPQALNDLKATRLPTCLLINFGKSGVALRRFGLERAQDAPTPGGTA